MGARPCELSGPPRSHSEYSPTRARLEASQRGSQPSSVSALGSIKAKGPKNADLLARLTGATANRIPQRKQLPEVRHSPGRTAQVPGSRIATNDGTIAHVMNRPRLPGDRQCLPVPRNQGLLGSPLARPLEVLRLLSTSGYRTPHRRVRKSDDSRLRVGSRQ